MLRDHRQRLEILIRIILICNNGMNQSVLSTLLRLEKRDLETRNRLLAEGRLYGVYAAEMQKVHRENAYELEAIISAHGWPGTSLVGSDGCRAAWLIAQHAICTPELQRKFLETLTEASLAGEAPAAQVAYLTDRIRFNEGRPQVYGTVLDWDTDGQLSCQIEEPDELDQRRKTVGLLPYAQVLRRHRQEVAAEGGKPPEDFAKYKKQANEWARQVGWRSD